MSCCIWWLITGFLLGWLLNWLLCKWTCNCKKKTEVEAYSPQPLTSSAPAVDETPAPAFVKAAEPEPVKAAAVAPVSAPEPVKTEPKAAAPVAAAAFVLDKSAAKAAGFKIKGPDDLTVIEGIGPKINQLFNKAGYHTFAEVAQMETAAMQKILDDAGPRYRLARPDTWAKQAELASQNKWEALKAWQDELDHGV